VTYIWEEEGEEEAGVDVREESVGGGERGGEVEGGMRMVDEG
jgi:hypothetical protein